MKSLHRFDFTDALHYNRGAMYKLLAVIAVTGAVLTASAQELEPRAYSPAPIGTNFLALGYSYSSGDVVIDPSVPLTDVSARIQAVIPAYSRTFNLGGHLASFAGALPLVHGNVEGTVGEDQREVTREGIGDARFRFSSSLLADSALTREEFVKRKPEGTFGASLSIVAPTGDYKNERLINIGSNRWVFKPELGGSLVHGSWFLDGSAGVAFFTDNPAFFGGVRKSQDPIGSIQAHGGYTFVPGMWLAFDSTYYAGGETTVGGNAKHDTQANSRIGLTLAVPVTSAWSLKLAVSDGFTTRIGGDFTTFAAAVQYRWFDE